MCADGRIGDSAPANPSSVPPPSELYIGYDISNGVISAAYGCSKLNEKNTA